MSEEPTMDSQQAIVQAALRRVRKLEEANRDLLDVVLELKTGLERMAAFNDQVCKGTAEGIQRVLDKLNQNSMMPR